MVPSNRWAYRLIDGQIYSIINTYIQTYMYTYTHTHKYMNTPWLNKKTWNCIVFYISDKREPIFTKFGILYSRWTEIQRFKVYKIIFSSFCSIEFRIWTMKICTVNQTWNYAAQLKNMKLHFVFNSWMVSTDFYEIWNFHIYSVCAD